MAGHRYINSRTLFDDEDDDDDTSVDSFRSKIPPPNPKPTAPSYGGRIGELERQRQVMLQKKKEIEQRTLDSSAISISLLRESEQIGIATAVELVRQHEQLESTNRRLDEINANLNYSQKHLNGIKSVFYGIKNYLSGKSDQTPSRSVASPDNRSMKPGISSGLEQCISNSPSFSTEDRFNSHPSTRLRGFDVQATAEPISDSQTVNEMLDANLDEMVQHISRLKGLGTALGQEINTQNKLLDTLQDKVEVADIKIVKQNKQMNKILGK